MKQTLKPIILCLIGCIIITATFAQQSRVDSIALLLTEIKLPENIDTAKVIVVLNLIEYTELSDQQIEAIEKTADNSLGASEIGLRYRIRNGIMYSLVQADVDRAIDYGRRQVSEMINLDDTYLPWVKEYFLRQLRLPYRNSARIEEGIAYFNKQVIEAKAQQDSITLAVSYYVLGGFYRNSGLTDEAIYNMQKSLSYMDTLSTNRKVFFGLSKPNNMASWMNNFGVLGMYYVDDGQFRKAINIYSYLQTRATDAVDSSWTKNSLAETLILIDSLDAVPDWLNKPNVEERNWDQIVYLTSILQLEALYHIKKGNFEWAEQNLLECWQLIDEYDIPPSPFAGIIAPDYYFALLRIAQGRFEDAIAYLEKDMGRVANLRFELLRDYKLQAELYHKIGNSEMAATTYVKFIALQDAILSDQSRLRKNSFELEKQMNAQELSIATLENDNRITELTRNFTIGLALLLLALATLAFSRYRTKQQDNRLLSEALNNLKSTQRQLIQSEKMASLGELTAGIAHEIQNPLNFVNNFSEVSNELMEEMREELDKGDIEEAKALSDDIRGNLEKITHHGKRADAIVKGMLAHSRAGKGEKEPTDLNALAEEYLKLSYHGLRAKDKSFNADFKTDFDSNLPKVNVVPQDIGRVLLNLINNAFQAVGSEGIEKPTVTISSTRVDFPFDQRKPVLGGNEGSAEAIQITITDNGPGIPNSIKDKIFQPFFTTKPTGEGTGLGLSLSYDIVKAHGGEIKVTSTIGKGTEFIIQLNI